MNYAGVFYNAIVAYLNATNIAPDYSPWPYTTVLTNHDITNDISGPSAGPAKFVFPIIYQQVREKTPLPLPTFCHASVCRNPAALLGIIRVH